MRRCALLLLLLLGMSIAAQGEVAPVVTGGDARFATVNYVEHEAIRLQTSAGGTVGIMFDPKEQIEKVIVGDNTAYQVTVPSSADAVFVRSLRAVASTTMSVRTHAHNYDFVLNSSSSSRPPYIVEVRLASPAPPLQQLNSAPVPTFPDAGTYKVKGSAALRPVGMNDDGLRTYIQWSPSQAIPAVFALGSDGQEEMVNGYMRNGSFTIDRVLTELVFRIDKAKATATRVKKKPKR